MDFKEFPKIFRLYREIIVTEKIDGSNGLIAIDETPDGAVSIQVGSHKRWITPENDNFGFASWVKANQDELLKLGKGYHYGEWWGNGIQRGYGQPKGVRHFSLFNVHRWDSSSPKYQERPSCCKVVPILYQGPFSEEKIQYCLDELKINGSHIAPFMDPEGIVVYHTQSNTSWKITLDGDEHKNA